MALLLRAFEVSGLLCNCVVDRIFSEVWDVVLGRSRAVKILGLRYQ